MPELKISASDQQAPSRLPLWFAPFADWKFLSILGLFLLIGLLALNDVQIYNPDSTRYLVWARSLAEFRGFEDTSIPEPFHYVVHAPLYPVLLVPAAVVAPYSIVGAKILTLLTGVVLLGLIYRWLRRTSENPFALGGALLLAVHPLTVLFSNQVLSDIPFACVILLVLLVTDRIARSQEPTPRIDLLLSGLLAAGILLREAGITLFFAALVFFLARGDLRRTLTIGALPAIAYGLWFIRNEILVAGTEFPPLRNSEIFTLRYFTERDAPFLGELIARLRVNFEVYADHVLRLISFPQFGPSPYGVVSVYGFPYSVVMPVAPFLTLPLGILFLGLTLYGMTIVLRRPGSGGLIVAFLPVYLLLIFFYPFNDVRFLYPLLVIMLLLVVAGSSHLVQWLKPRFPWVGKVAIAAGFVSLLPNLLWCYAFVREGADYRQSPEAVYERVADERPFPDLLTKPMGKVGSWLTERNSGEMVVMTQWKELTLWLPKGKLIELNPLVPLDEFERFIRDYRVEYVVSAVGLAGIPEFFTQMQMSGMYDFRSEFRAANLEVFRVVDERGSGVETVAMEEHERWSRENLYRRMFGAGISLLSEGRADSARALFEELAGLTQGGSTILLHLAIAHEFEGNYPRALSLLVHLQLMKQAGAFLGHATYHREIIGLLERAGREQRPAQKAEMFYVVSVKYWNLGFRNQSLKLLKDALDVDPRFAPALVFGVYYSLELGHEREAQEYFRLLSATVSDHPLVGPLRRIIAYRDSLGRRLIDPNVASVGLAKAYQEAGLGDSAIGVLLSLRDPSPQAGRLLADLYVSKRRYYPALQVLNRLLNKTPDPEVQALAEDLKSRW